MGANNVMRVYLGWAASLNDRPFRLLSYMALVSVDGDSEPWFGQGHDVLASTALGLKCPSDNDKERAAALRIVRRHISPLFAAGAIETRRRATSGNLGVTHVVYRLYLDGPGKDSPFPTGRVLPAEWTGGGQQRPAD